MSTETRWARDLAEAMEILAAGAEEGSLWTAVAGGEEALGRCADAPRRALLLGEVEALKGLEEREGALSVGPLVGLEALRRDPSVAALVPEIVEALEQAPEGTVIGELDDLRATMARMGAEATVLSHQGMRIHALEGLVLGPEELIFRITVSKSTSERR